MADAPFAAVLAHVARTYEKGTQLEAAGNMNGALVSYAVAATFIPRLLASLEAVLALPAEWDAKGRGSSALEEDRAWVREDCARELREAVAAALTGKGKADD